MTLANAYLSTGKFDKALSLAESWKQADTKNIQAYMLAGYAYLYLKNQSHAKVEFNQVLVLEPQNTVAKIALIDLSLAEKNDLDAIKRLNEVLQIQPDSVDALGRLYVIAKDQESKQNVIDKIKSKVATYPENIILKLLYAQILLTEQDDTITAINVLTDIIVDEKLPTIYWTMLGKAYIETQQYKAAETHFQQWLSFEPNNRIALLNNLILLDAQNQHDKVLTLSRSFLNKRQNEQITLLYIQSLISTGALEQAEKSYQQLADTTKQLPFSKGLLGQLQIQNKHYKDALDNLNIAYAAQPNSRNGRLVYYCLTQLKQHGKAKAFLSTHIQAYPNDLSSLMLLASMQIKQNKDEAIISYQRVLELNSNNFIALNNLAYLFFEKGEFKQAKGYAERALVLKPEQPEVLDTLAQILVAQKEYNQALSYLTTAVANKTVSEEITLNYIEALLLNEQYALARRKVREGKFLLSSSKEKIIQLKAQYAF